MSELISTATLQYDEVLRVYTGQRYITKTYMFSYVLDGNMSPISVWLASQSTGRICKFTPQAISKTYDQKTMAMIFKIRYLDDEGLNVILMMSWYMNDVEMRR